MLALYASYYYVADALLSALQVLTHLILMITPWYRYMTHFQMTNVKHREAEWLIQGRTDNNWQS